MRPVCTISIRCFSANMHYSHKAKRKKDKHVEWIINSLKMSITYILQVHPDPVFARQFFAWIPPADAFFSHLPFHSLWRSRYWSAANITKLTEIVQINVNRMKDIAPTKNIVLQLLTLFPAIQQFDAVVDLSENFYWNSFCILFIISATFVSICNQNTIYMRLSLR